MINCQEISFSQKLQQQRMAQAQSILGTKVTDHFICFALYLLGVSRKSISTLTNTPPGTIRSRVRAILSNGLSALEDRRSRASTFLPPQEKETVASIYIEEQSTVVDFGTRRQLKIPRQNILQTRVILLTMLQSNLLSSRDVSEVLGFSTVHTGNLAKKLHTGDIAALIDKRQGQKQEYLFTSDIKAELICQFVLDIVTSSKSSGKLLAKQLNKRCKLTLSERSIRYHIEKLGLSKVKKSLPQLISGLKKK